MKKKNNNDEKIYKELALSKQLGEIPTRYSIGVYHSSKGDRYIDIVVSTKIVGYLYFRLFDSNAINTAAKCARISMGSPLDIQYPKQYYCFDTRLENWELDQHEVDDLCYTLSMYNPEIKYPKFLRNSPIRQDVLYWIMQNCHNKLAEQYNNIQKIEICQEYLMIPNYQYLIKSNRPKKLKFSSIESCGIVCFDEWQMEKVKYNLSEKMNETKYVLCEIGDFSVNGKNFHVGVMPNDIEPEFLIADNSIFLGATNIVKLSMIHPRYIEPTDTPRPYAPKKLSSEEMDTFIKFISNPVVWEDCIDGYNSSIDFFEGKIKIPVDSKIPDYKNLEESLII